MHSISRVAVRSVSCARSLSTTAPTQGVKKVTIVGSGLMGSGITQVAAATNHTVTMVDVNDVVLGKAMDRIKQSLARVAKKNYKDEAEGKAYVDKTMSNISTQVDPSKSVADCDLVIEAIPENMDLKHKLFSSLDIAAPAKTIFASNTSSFRIGKIAEVTKRKDRFGGLHFFNPVPVMKLVEVIRTPETSQATFDALKSFGEAVGKHVVECKDTPGFIVNRLLVPYLLEAMRMVERGEATTKDIDAAMKLGAGYPMGPFELADYVGLDTTSFISQGWSKDYPEVELFKPVPLLDKLVAEKKTGRKSGEGFYKYEKQ